MLSGSSTSSARSVSSGRGATINAIRLLAKAAAVKAGEKVDVDIVEE